MLIANKKFSFWNFDFEAFRLLVVYTPEEGLACVMVFNNRSYPILVTLTLWLVDI